MFAQNEKLIGLKNIFSAICFAVGVGWLGDSIKGEVIFKAWLGESTSAPAGLLLALIWCFAFGIWLYRDRHSFLPVRHLQEQGAPTARKVLVICVSKQFAKIKIENEDIEIIFSTSKSGNTVDKSVHLTGNLNEDKENSLFTETRWSWQQILRAVAHHMGQLEKVYLIGSCDSFTTEDKKVEGSSSDLHYCKAILEKYGLTVEIILEAVNFENVAALNQVIEYTVRKASRGHIKQNDIIIDCTGGQKPTSIAAAMVTLQFPEIAFQYVQTGGPRKEVISYNIANSRSELD